MQEINNFDQLSIQEFAANEKVLQLDLSQGINSLQIEDFPQSKITSNSHEPDDHSSMTRLKLTEIRTLPTDIIIRIAARLAPVDRAAFAFTGRWVHKVIGNALKLNQGDRISLLSLLERDGMWPSEILCTICAAFHRPRNNRIWSIQEGNRACIRQGDRSLESQSVSPYIPRHIHFDLISAISRSHRLDPKSPSPRILDFVYPYLVEEGHGLRIRTEHTGRISPEGHVLLKTEHILYPGPCTGLNSEAIMEGAQDLRLMLQQFTPLGSICGHARWIDLYPFIFKPELHYIWKPGQWSIRDPNAEDFDLPGGLLQECVWTHKGDCWLYCEANSRLDSGLDGRLWACGMCSTEYAVNIIRVPRSTCNVNFLAMTSWKDLGSCKDRFDSLWREHVDMNLDQEHDRPVFEIAKKFDDPAYRDVKQSPEALHISQVSIERLRHWFLSGKEDGI